MSAFTHALSTNNYGSCKFIVSTSLANGTHVTLASALAVASVGDTVFLRDTVTENVTIPPGVNISAWQGGFANTPAIIGTVTMTGAGTSTISGIRLQTNGANAIIMSGASASVLQLYNCFLAFTNADGIAITNANAILECYRCPGDLGTTGIKIFANTGGVLDFWYCNIGNSGNSITASTQTAGTVQFFYCVLSSPMTTSGTSTLGFFFSSMASATTIPFTISGSGTNSITHSIITSGTISNITLNTNTLTIHETQLHTTNTNPITGTGSLTFSGLTFSSTGTTLNTTTLIPIVVKGGWYQGNLTSTAPIANAIGERISSAVAAGTPANNTPTTLTSIALTPGVWDISCIATFAFTGLSTIVLANISTTTNAIVGTLGDAYAQEIYVSATGINKSLSVPVFRVLLSANATYYLVVQNNFSTGATSVNGRISAVRVA